jgi:small subunit ribosomal protein S2
LQERKVEKADEKASAEQAEEAAEGKKRNSRARKEEAPAEAAE